MQGCGAAEGDHGVFAQVLAVLDSVDPRGVGHVFVNDFGMPLTIKPNFEDKSCDFYFGLTPPPIDWSPGLRLTVKTALPVAIVLLGARMALDQIVGMGSHALILIGSLMALALGMAHAVGRWLGVPVRIATLIAVGAAICGNTAIAALAPVIRAREDDGVIAVAISTLLGPVAALPFPLVGHALPAGRHTIRVVNEGTGVDETKTVTISAGELTKVVF